MGFVFKSKYWAGILLAVLLAGADTYFLYETRWFLAGLIIAAVIGFVLILLDFTQELKRQKEIELKFLEFVRNMVESVKSGISIPQSIMYISKKDYGALTPYIKKLANQIEWGIPPRRALIIFSLDTGNSIIKRSVSIIVEAEKSGGDITDVLNSVVDSVMSIKKIKEERKSSMYSQVIQGYIVFYIFIGIMLSLQLWLFPKITTLSTSLQEGLSGIASSGFDLNKIFLSLVLIQGFFAGIMIGKFSEGTLKRGLLHSVILMTTSALIIVTVKGTI